ncbi:MAG: hypothetical protein JJU20_11430, partial [Opitutales bacterium]|nr:hypothetical protein [Opitutales bacterium]
MNLKDLKNPPAFDRPWPLFVLNGEYDEDKDLIHLKESLEALKRTGFGGVYLHPRPGLITNYLSSRWFELIEALILHCIELELIPALYDENSYPSGGAGGHVCSIQPETRARSIV